LVRGRWRRFGPIREPRRAHLPRSGSASARKKYRVAAARNLPARFFITDVRAIRRQSSAWQIAGVLHDASPDRVGNCVSTSTSKLLLNVSSTIIDGEGHGR